GRFSEFVSRLPAERFSTESREKMERRGAFPQTGFREYLLLGPDSGRPRAGARTTSGTRRREWRWPTPHAMSGSPFGGRSAWSKQTAYAASPFLLRLARTDPGERLLFEHSTGPALLALADRYRNDAITTLPPATRKPPGAPAAGRLVSVAYTEP